MGRAIVIACIVRKISRMLRASSCRGLTILRTRHERHTFSGGRRRLFDLWQLWDYQSRKINPDSCVIPNNGGGAMSPLETERFGEHVPMLVADRQARHGVMPPWRNGKTAKEFRAVLGRKPMVGLFGVGLEEQYRWKDSVQSDAEIRIWALDWNRQWCAAMVQQVQRGLA
jgi:hypothetical protein